jgi:hypothetical protein
VVAGDERVRRLIADVPIILAISRFALSLAYEWGGVIHGSGGLYGPYKHKLCHKSIDRLVRPLEVDALAVVAV